MFMNTDSGRKHLSELPEANRDYNLVEGEVIPNKIIVQHPKGVTISELMAIDKKLTGQPLTNEAWELLQKLAIYTMQEINNILGSTGFFETESIVRAVAIWLENSPELKEGLLPHIGKKLNKITPKNLKDVDSQYYKYHVYAEELMQVEKNNGHGISANIKGLSVYGIVIFSLLQILLISVIDVRTVITDQMIKEQIRTEPNLRVLYAGELPYRNEEEVKLFGTPTSSPERSPSVMAVSGETQKIDDPKMYKTHTDMVKNFYAMRLSLLTSKATKKEVTKTFNDTAGHTLYNLVVTFIKGVFNTNDETGKIIKESMLIMVTTYLDQTKVSHNCHEMVLAGAKAYMKTNLADVPLKNKQIIAKSQASLITLMKSEKIHRSVDGNAFGVLLFSLGSLISCVLSDSKKSGIVTGKDITDELNGDDDLKKFNQNQRKLSVKSTVSKKSNIKSTVTMKSLSKNSTMEFIEKNIDLDWDIESIQNNPNLTRSFVDRHPEFAWDQDFLDVLNMIL